MSSRTTDEAVNKVVQGLMSKKAGLRLSGCLLALAVLGGLIYFGINLLFAGMCGNEVTATILSPDRRLKAVVFDRNCGATTDFSTQISVITASSNLPNDGGNILVCDSDHGLVPSGPGGGPPVTIQWTVLQRLSIQYPAKARTFAQERQVTAKTGWFQTETVAIDYTTISGH